MYKRSTCSHICAVHSLTRLLCPRVGLDGYFQNWEVFKKNLGSIHDACVEASYRCEDPEAK